MVEVVESVAHLAAELWLEESLGRGEVSCVHVVLEVEAFGILR